MPHVSFSSPVGDLTLCSEDEAITALHWDARQDQAETPLLKKAKAQLLAYFEGECEVFDLPLSPEGTDFQNRVWSAMQKIPYGQVQTYGALASKISSGPRPVGTACGINPIPILIPCHRVVAAQGLGGYSGAGGLATKQTLLALEGHQLRI